MMNQPEYKPLNKVKDTDLYFLCDCCKDRLNCCRLDLGDICFNCGDQICLICQHSDKDKNIRCCLCNDNYNFENGIIGY